MASGDVERQARPLLDELVDSGLQGCILVSRQLAVQPGDPQLQDALWETLAQLQIAMVVRKHARGARE